MGIATNFLKEYVLTSSPSGPGGSSMLGLFMELGPCKVSDDNFNTTTFNPYSWTNFANVIFIESVPLPFSRLALTLVVNPLASGSQP